jgi:hypothetical protein
MPKTRDWEDRDELAAMFMQATIAGLFAFEARGPDDWRPEARAAYKMADAFLAVRAQGPPGKLPPFGAGAKEPIPPRRT